MKNTMYRKMLSLVLSLVMLTACFSTQVLALDETNAEEAYMLDSAAGSVYSSLDNVFERTAVRSTGASLRNVNLTVAEKAVHFNATLVWGEEFISLSAAGKAYGFDGGAKDGAYYLIDFPATEEIVFVQVKIDTTTVVPNLYLLLQESENESLLEFTIALNSTLVASISAISDNTNKSKTMELFRLENNIIDSVDTSITINAAGDTDTTLLSASPSNSKQLDRASVTRDASDVPYATWTRFFNQLKSSGYTYLDTYEIDSEVILNNGWTFRTCNGSVPYAVASYAVQNGSDQRLIQIIRLNLTFHNLASNAEFQMEAVDIMSLSYNEYSGRIDVLYYNFGPHLDNIKIAVQCPTSGQTIFIKEVITNDLATTPSTLRLFAAFISPLGTIVDIWDALDTGVVASRSGESYTRLFEETYAQQVEEDIYGRVVRAVAATSGSHKIDSEGHYMTIDGKLVNGYAGCSTWAYTYNIDVI